MLEKYAEVLMEFAKSQEIDRTFTYKIPEALLGTIQVGMRVFIPFGRNNKLQEGYVISLRETTDVPANKMKNIHSMIDEFTAISEEMLELAFFIRERYNCTLAGAIDIMLPPGSKGRPIKLSEKKTKYIELKLDENSIMGHMKELKTKKSFVNQYNILKILLDVKRAPVKQMAKSLEITESSFNTLNKKGLVNIYTETTKFTNDIGDVIIEEGYPLNEEQQVALDCIYESVNKDEYQTFLLHGITGSGKTEIFLQLIASLIKRNQEAIVLVPEISLTPQTVSRFRRRFGDKVGITHSRMNNTERMDQWLLAKKGEISVMIGPRSAVFTPFKNLKTIVVDEEHEGTYKSETTPKYHAKEVAEFRMKNKNGIILLASATPNLESYYKTETKEYKLLEISKRVYDRPLPEVEIVDMREEMAVGNKYVFSESLYVQIQEVLDRNEQVMLFLNRRGHSTFVSCRSCGHAIKCNHCNITMTYHANRSNLICHYCGKTIKNPKVCPECKSEYIKYFGDGTQKIEEETKFFFPDAKIQRMDLDTTGRKNSHHEILKEFKDGNTDILIGTQMIAKGHDFPNVTLVGVLAADSSLYMQDFRASERTFQLLTQVTGRAGRGEKLGRVVVQTYNPDNYCIQIAAEQDYKAFYNEEIILREQMRYPPFTHIFSVLITSDKEREVIRWSNRLMDYYNVYNKDNDFELFGPIPAAISKIADIYRWRIIIKSDERNRLNSYGLYCISKLKELDKPSTIEIQSDIDPIMLY